MTENLEGQMSLFAQDTWSGKMSQEHCQAEKTKTERRSKAKTSDASLKKLQESPRKMPLFLDLRKADGVIADASWEMGGRLLGGYMTHSFGELPREENVSLLSQILQERPPQKYSLSPKACIGILKRANRRGKKLPEILQKALEAQAMR